MAETARHALGHWDAAGTLRLTGAWDAATVPGLERELLERMSTSPANAVLDLSVELWLTASRDSAAHLVLSACHVIERLLLED
jgi:hypothetical protein